MALSPLQPNDPDTLGPYRLQGRLGAGGMGVVYLAFGPDAEPVALKVLQPLLAENAEYRARFVREVEAARLVESAYVVRLLGAETETAPLWLATEYIEGATLRYAVETHGPVPEDRLRGLAGDLAAALAALHGVGLIHRDLKPANVVLAWSGPKLIDFGIAKQEGASDLTSTGMTVGSPLWLSPEVLGGAPASRASDVFAWGLCIAFAGTGRAPFGETNPAAVAYRIMNEPPDLEGLSGGVHSLVGAALAKDPADRPDAQDLIAALGSHEETAPVAIPRPEGGWTGPRSTAAGAPDRDTRATTLMPGAAAGEPAADSPDDNAKTPGSRRVLVAVLAVLVVAAAVAITLATTLGDGKSRAQPTPPITPSTSGSPTGSPTQTGSPTGAPSTTPASPLLPVFASLTQAQALIMDDGYTADQDAASFWNPQAPINAIIGTLTSSADGASQWAFFFAGNQYIGHDTKDPSYEVNFVGRTENQITLAYTIYKPNEPVCCPTGGTKKVRFQWNGKTLVPLDPIPSSDPTKNHR